MNFKLNLKLKAAKNKSRIIRGTALALPFLVLSLSFLSLMPRQAMPGAAFAATKTKTQTQSKAKTPAKKTTQTKTQTKAKAKTTTSKSRANDLDSQIKSQQQAKRNLEKKIKQYNELAKQKSRESKTLLGRLTRLKQDASASQNKMVVLERENGRLQSSMGELNKNIETTSAKLSGLLIRLQARVTEMYKYSAREGLDILLASEDTHDALTTAYMLGCFARQDQDIIEELTTRAAELKQSRSKLEESREQVQRQSEELKKKRAEFDTTIKQTNALLSDIQSEQKKAQAAAQELTNAQKEIGNRISALMKQKRDRDKKTQQTKTSGTAKAAARSAPAVRSLEWPVRGTVVAPFGSRVHPTFKTKIFNSGIDIKAASGTSVRAAAPGEVLFKGWIRGFGQVVIVDHGGNLSTVYAHLASASVREGERVKTGSVLGRVGNSGTDSTYGLHFEVRRDGTAQNPMNYLKRR